MGIMKDEHEPMIAMCSLPANLLQFYKGSVEVHFHLHGATVAVPVQRSLGLLGWPWMRLFIQLDVGSPCHKCFVWSATSSFSHTTRSNPPQLQSMATMNPISVYAVVFKMSLNMSILSRNTSIESTDTAQTPSRSRQSHPRNYHRKCRCCLLRWLPCKLWRRSNAREVVNVWANEADYRRGEWVNAATLLISTSTNVSMIYYNFMVHSHVYMCTIFVPYLVMRRHSSGVVD